MKISVAIKVLDTCSGRHCGTHSNLVPADAIAFAHYFHRHVGFNRLCHASHHGRCPLGLWWAIGLVLAFVVARMCSRIRVVVTFLVYLSRPSSVDHHDVIHLRHQTTINRAPSRSDDRTSGRSKV
ncbi:uncharacterized protein K489DRAFT_87807 [Dissoconium aciculare CBS 342.82]|uniref:Uncharacterized protein n=1 Tax=Dissoconium aciculare CBS 342.82 TaxID=1314786 RepID=A0A6J3LS88_9PEZI|nr:uncharacterized protein K489DRAFT_87807 [Dissoconium aciculare CBS 342.82]KAF1818656.1 hypothetical protein K489DRAFT_87807 [Dissoconium aciculare CBS 342.82]